MAIKLNGKKNQEDLIAKYRNDQQSLTQRIIENTSRSYRPSCDPHGQVFYSSRLSSHISTEAVIEAPDQSSDNSSILAQTSSNMTVTPTPDFETALYRTEQEAFAATWEQPAALAPPGSFCTGEPDNKDDLILDQETTISKPPDCGRIMEIDDSMPGIKRTKRGTIEFVRFPDGKTITPHYNRCGIMTSIGCNDGSRIVKSEGQFPWIVLDAHGRHVEELKIVQLNFDRAGNLIYVTAGGERTTLRIDGTVLSEPASRGDLHS